MAAKKRKSQGDRPGPGKQVRGKVSAGTRARSAAAKRGWETRRKNEALRAKAAQKTAETKKRKKTPSPSAETRKLKKALEDALAIKRSEAAKRGAATRKARKAARAQAANPTLPQDYKAKPFPVPSETPAEIREIRSVYTKEKSRLQRMHTDIRPVLEKEKEVIKARVAKIDSHKEVLAFIRKKKEEFKSMSLAEVLSKLSEDEAMVLVATRASRKDIERYVLTHMMMGLQMWQNQRVELQLKAIDIVINGTSNLRPWGDLKTAYRHMANISLGFIDGMRSRNVYERIQAIMNTVSESPFASTVANSLAEEYGLTSREVYACFYGSPTF
jgi:hypothetical protein